MIRILILVFKTGVFSCKFCTVRRQFYDRKIFQQFSDRPEICCLAVTPLVLICCITRRKYLCVYVQVILPPTDSVVLDLSREFGGLEGLQIQLSKAVITNCHVGDSGQRSRSNLRPVIRSLGASACVVWDGKSPVDFTAPHGTSYITQLLQSHAESEDRGTIATTTALETVVIRTDKGKPSSLLTDGFSANR